MGSAGASTGKGGSGSGVGGTSGQAGSASSGKGGSSGPGTGGNAGEGGADPARGGGDVSEDEGGCSVGTRSSRASGPSSHGVFGLAWLFAAGLVARRSRRHEAE
jgi:MYXO-CTERM domain-containing protein